MAAWLDICRYLPTAGGTTDWTFSAAVTGYQSPTAAGVTSGRLYKYRAESADLTQWEIGEGAYNTGTGVLARTTVLFNNLGTTAKINFTNAPQVAIVALKEDMISIEESNSFSATQRAQARTNISAVLSGHLYGCTLSAAGSSATFAIAIGECADSTSVDLLSYSSAIAKTTSAWTVGTANGSLDTGTIAASTWYYPYAIKRPDTGVTDILTSLAPNSVGTVTMTIASPCNVTYTKHGLQANAEVIFTTTGALPTGLTAGTQYFVKTVVDIDTFTVSATQGGTVINTSGSQSGTHTATSNPILPTNYTLFRRLGALLTDGSSQWVAFLQKGTNFYWQAPVYDINQQAIPTSPTNYVITVPKGFSVRPIISVNAGAGASGANARIRIYSPLLADNNHNRMVSPGLAGGTGALGGVDFGTTTGQDYTNAAAQVRAQNTAADTGSPLFDIFTYGWIDDLGKF